MVNNKTAGLCFFCHWTAKLELDKPPGPAYASPSIGCFPLADLMKEEDSIFSSADECRGLGPI